MRWRDGHGNRVDAKLTVEAQLVIAENTISVGHSVIPLKQGSCSLLSRSNGTIKRGLFWLHMQLIWSELNDPGAPPDAQGHKYAYLKVPSFVHRLKHVSGCIQYVPIKSSTVNNCLAKIASNTVHSFS